MRSARRRASLVVIGAVAVVIVGIVGITQQAGSPDYPDRTLRALAAPTTTLPATTIPATTVRATPAPTSRSVAAPSVEALPIPLSSMLTTLVTTSDPPPETTAAVVAAVPTNPAVVPPSPAAPPPESSPSEAVPPVLIATTAGLELIVRVEPRADAEVTMVEPALNEWDMVTSYPVVEEHVGADGGWYRVRLPHRPNGLTGWVAAADVQLSASEWRLTVSLSGRTLTAERAGVPELTVPVAVGTDANPTPVGTGFVRAVIAPANAGGPYGPLVFAIGLHSDTLTDFAGGDGEAAIHGTNAPGKIGQAVSHGCVRLHNDDVLRLSELGLPLGTPVEIIA